MALMVVACSQKAVQSQDNIIMGTDDENLEADYKIESSKFLKDKTNNDYRSDKSYDGKNDTAWCVGNNGVGEWIKFYFRPGPAYIREVLKGKRNVHKINIMNGFAANKKLYYENNRIKKMKVEFDEGERRIIEFKDGVFDYQSFKFNIRSKWVKLTILEIYKGTKYNDTCISELDFRTIYDLSQDEIKKYKESK